MVILILENATERLKGVMTRYLSELKPGVYAGDLTANVRDLLWENIVTKEIGISGIMIYNAPSEQGFATKTIGTPKRYLEDFDGITLVSRDFNHGLKLEEIWAKKDPHKSINTHSVEVGITAKMLMSYGCMKPIIKHVAGILDNPENEIINFVSFLCSMHDIGKIHPLFQNKSDEMDMKLDSLKTNMLKMDFRHERYSMFLMKRFLKEKEKFSRFNANRFAEVLAMHHQNHLKENDVIKPDVGEEIWESLHNELYNEMRNIFSFKMNLKKEIKNVDAVCFSILGILVIADWIASNDIVYQNVDRKDFSNDTDYFLKIEDVCLKFLTDNHLMYRPVEKIGTFESVFHIPKNSQRPIQSAIEQEFATNQNQRLCIIEAPCGEGKTEAGLYAALKMGVEKNGLYMGLPTSATSEAMLPRFTKLLQNLGMEKPPLFINRSWLKSNCYNINHTEWVSNSRQKFLYPSAIGTLDQALMSMFPVKYGIIRLAGIMGKAIIIDEIHAYDAYMMGIIKVFLLFCKIFDIPVIMLSATLPKKVKQELLSTHCETNDLKIKDAYPLITMCYTDGRINQIATTACRKDKDYTLTLLPFLNNKDLVVNNVLRKIKDGGCLSLIVNTVDDAIELYKKLEQSKTSDTELYLFHARHTVKEKERKTAEVVKLFGKDRANRPAKAIVVSTQIIEQSIDVDFDYICTYIAPFDLLIQRFGRLHRHSDIGTIRELVPINEPIVVYVPDIDTGPYQEKYGKSSYVYKYEEVMEKTYHVLKNLKNSALTIPSDVPKYVNEVYSDNRLMNILENIKELNAYGKTLDRPREDVFTLYENRATLGDTTIETRQSELETVSVALVDEDMFAIIKDANANGSPVNFELCKNILLSHTVSISFYKLKDFESCESENGLGLLFGTRIYKTDHLGRVLNANEKRMYIDNTYGLVIE